MYSKRNSENKLNTFVIKIPKNQKNYPSNEKIKKIEIDFTTTKYSPSKDSLTNSSQTRMKTETIKQTNQIIIITNTEEFRPSSAKKTSNEKDKNRKSLSELMKENSRLKTTLENRYSKYGSPKREEKADKTDENQNTTYYQKKKENLNEDIKNTQGYTKSIIKSAILNTKVEETEDKKKSYSSKEIKTNYENNKINKELSDEKVIINRRFGFNKLQEKKFEKQNTMDSIKNEKNDNNDLYKVEIKKSIRRGFKNPKPDENEVKYNETFTVDKNNKGNLTQKILEEKKNETNEITINTKEGSPRGKYLRKKILIKII